MKLRKNESAVETITRLWSCGKWKLWSCGKCKRMWWSGRSPSKCPKCGVKPSVCQPDSGVSSKRKRKAL